MASLSTWIRAFRLRTLPLSVSGVVMGSFLALSDDAFRWPVFLLAFVTTLLLQILSNLANDYGDSQNGADNTGRIGPERTVQSGAISPRQMREMIFIFITLSLISGIALLTIAGLDYTSRDFQWLLGIGILAILAALFYTMGRIPYGYLGLGDFSVLLFFGYFSVMATYYLHSKSLPLHLILPATSVGLLSVGVLNLNNMRDAQNDLASGKRTLANFIGLKRSRIYHASIVSLAFVLAFIFVLWTGASYWSLISMILLIPVFLHLKRLYNYADHAHIDRELKTLAIIALAFTVLFGIGINL